MARRAFAVSQLVEILMRWQRGESLRAIAGSLAISRNTVREYVRMAETGGLPREPAVSHEALTAFVSEHFPAAAGRGTSVLWRRELDVRREEIAEGLKTNRVGTVWARMHASGRIKTSLSTFRRYVRQELPAPVDPQEVVVHGPEATPGEWAEVDYGRLGPWLDPRTGNRRTLWAFVMVLAYSRHVFVWPVLKMDQRAWLEAHVRAFQFFGGVVERLVLDNLKAGVLKPDIYSPHLNRAYGELGLHYDVLLDPARSGHPKDKPRVERLMPFVREHLYHGREERFADLEAGGRFAEQWCRDEAGVRTQRTTRRRPYEAFQQEELPVLRPLPESAWEIYVWARAKVAPDCYCSVAGAYYTVPYGQLHRELDVRLSDRQVEFFDRGQVVKVHARVPKGRRSTDPADFPPDRIAFYQRTPQWCLKEAALLGPGVHAAIHELLQVHTSAHLRQAQGILRLSDTFGGKRLNAACQRAADYGDPRYMTVKNILQAGLDGQPYQIPLVKPAPVIGAGAYLRGAAAYAGRPRADGVAATTEAPLGGEAPPQSR